MRETNFKVVLTGEGADEIMAGYNIFKEAQVRRFWARNPESDTRPMLLQRLYPYIFAEGSEKAKRYLKAFFKKGLAHTDSPLYSHLPRWHNTSQLRHFFSEALQGQTDDAAAFEKRFEASLPTDFMQWPALSPRAVYRNAFVPDQLSAQFPGGPHGNGPFGGRPLSLPGLPGH